MEGEIKTIEDLAALIQNTMASKEDVQALDKKVTEGFERGDSRLDRIEHLLMEEQKRKIEDLEQGMKRLEDALAL
jgi:hypothetical protein